MELHFDKELENGEHEIYLTIIDNAGSVIAKSNPLPFVKTADAFTRADAMSAALEAQNAQPSFTNKNNMIFIASVIIVSLGLVLLLIGAFTRSKNSLKNFTYFMIQSAFSLIISGYRYVRKHPELLMTIVLMCVIPIAFVASGLQF